MNKPNLRLPILKFLNEDSTATYDVEKISQKFPQGNKLYIKRVVEILEEDRLIARDVKHMANSVKINEKTGRTYPPDPIFRISPAGISYLSDRKKIRVSYILSICAIVISVISLIVKCS